MATNYSSAYSGVSSGSGQNYTPTSSSKNYTPTTQTSTTTVSGQYSTISGGVGTSTSSIPKTSSISSSSSSQNYSPAPISSSSTPTTTSTSSIPVASSVTGGTIYSSGEVRQISPQVSASQNTSNIYYARPTDYQIMPGAGGASPVVTKDVYGRTVNVDALQQGSSVIQRGDRTLNYATGEIQKFTPGAGEAYYQGVKGSWSPTNERITSKPSWYAKSQEQELARNTLVGLGVEKSTSTTKSSLGDESSAYNVYQGDVLKLSGKILSGEYSFYDQKTGIGGTSVNKTMYGGYSVNQGFGMGTQTRMSAFNPEVKVTKPWTIERAKNIPSEIMSTPFVGDVLAGFTGNVGKLNEIRESGQSIPVRVGRVASVELGFLGGGEVLGFAFGTASKTLQTLPVVGKSLFSVSIAGRTISPNIINLGEYALGAGFAYGVGKSFVNAKSNEERLAIGTGTILGIQGFGIGMGKSRALEIPSGGSKYYVPKIGEFTGEFKGKINPDVYTIKTEGGISLDVIGLSNEAPSTFVDYRSAEISGLRQVGKEQVPFRVSTGASGDVLQEFSYKGTDYALFQPKGAGEVMISKMSGNKIDTFFKPAGEIRGVNLNVEETYSKEKMINTQLRENLIMQQGSRESVISLIGENKNKIISGIGKLSEEKNIFSFSPNIEATKDINVIGRFVDETGAFTFSRDLRIQTKSSTKTTISLGESTTAPFLKSQEGELKFLGVHANVNANDIFSFQPIEKSYAKTSSFYEFPGVQKSTISTRTGEFTATISKNVKPGILSGSAFERFTKGTGSQYFNIGKKGQVNLELLDQTQPLQIPEEITKTSVSSKIEYEGLNKLRINLDTGLKPSESLFLFSKSSTRPDIKSANILGQSSSNQFSFSNEYNQVQQPKTNLSSITSISQVSGQTQSMAQTKDLINEFSTITGGEGISSLQSPNLPMPLTGGFPGFDIGGFGGQPSPIMNRPKSRKRKYSPSVAAIISGATIKKAPKGAFSGFEFRPVVASTGNLKKSKVFK